MKQTNKINNVRWPFHLMIISALVLFIAGCGVSEPAADDGKVSIVATIGMIADIAENVGGDHVTVESLMGSGVDPHAYQASEGDVRAIANADILFYNGLHLEAQMAEVFENMQGSITTVAVAEGIDESHLLAAEDYEEQFDPHVWFNVELWMTTVEAVRDTLVAQDPDNAAAYEANAQSYLAQLEELHAYVESRVQEIPEGQRVLITAHDAFNYFGDAYGFDVMGLQGISTESEAGTKDVQDLATFISENEIKAIFVESSVPRRNIEAVQEAVEAQGWSVVIGGELFSDAMGDAGTVEGTYIGMVEHNIDTITEALK